MFAIKIKGKDGRLYEIISPVKIPDGVIVRDKENNQFEVMKEIIEIKDPFYNSNKIDEMVSEMYELVEIKDED